jgi:dolichol-phosphate mannosyltransferase
MDLSVVIPAHNEAQSLGALLRELGAALAAVPDYEVVVVDDGSSDGTGEQATAAACEVPHLAVVRHPAPAGQSYAVLTGVRAAAGRWVATIDGDGQNDPADIPALLAARDRESGSRGPLLVAGYRGTRRDSWLKRVSSRVANGVRGRLLGDATPDTGCGLKLFEREAFLALPHFDHMHRFLPALFLRAGGRVVSVPVGHRPRLRGRSHYGLFNRLGVGIVDLFGVMWLMRRRRSR